MTGKPGKVGAARTPCRGLLPGNVPRFRRRLDGPRLRLKEPGACR
jgi:hypothetical protein